MLVPSCSSSPFLARTLHSFPTRRSSDLITLQIKPAYARRVPASPDTAISFFALQKNRMPVNPNIRERKGKKMEKIDRKSTRLNSSHVKISYAVFCLKKKKNT